MARKFVRNITGTKLTGDVKEPLHTNHQNDILSDEEHIYIRNKDNYHCLTDNLKNIKTPSDNNSIEVKRLDENTIEIIGNENLEGGTVTEIKSKSENLIVEKEKADLINLDLDLSDYLQKDDLRPFATIDYVEGRVDGLNIPEGGLDLSAYVTDEQLEERIGMIDFPDETPDLSGYASKSFVEKKIDSIDIPKIEGLASEEYVDSKIAELNIPDLADYVDYNYLDSALTRNLNDSKSYTDSELEKLDDNFTSFVNSEVNSLSSRIDSLPDNFDMSREISNQIDRINSISSGSVTISASNKLTFDVEEIEFKDTNPDVINPIFIKPYWGSSNMCYIDYDPSTMYLTVRNSKGTTVGQIDIDPI